MTLRRSSRDKRCQSCMVHKDNCFCGLLESVDLKTKTSIIIYKKEIFLPSNTAHLALKTLSNSQSFERGHRDQLLHKEFLDEENYQPLFLYPSDDAVELDSTLISKFTKPINLIVPDGTWRQAQKVHQREPLLTHIPKIKLTLNEKTKYTLRRQKLENGLCTFEAISYALRVIEGESICESLLGQFDIFQNAHLKNRDIFSKQKNKMGYS